MSHNDLFEVTYRLAEQLKGAPLRESEKEEIVDEFKNASGSVFERAKTAVASVLNADPAVIWEKGEARQKVNYLINDMKKAAQEK